MVKDRGRGEFISHFRPNLVTVSPKTDHKYSVNLTALVTDYKLK